MTADLPAVVSGPAEVVDGDTLRIGSVIIRLFGIDAPELDQRCGTVTCGRRAKARLVAIISGRPISCAPQDRDQYGRLVAVCRAGGQDINRAMVSQGWATAYRQFSQAYVADEAAARAARLGIWSMPFTPPAEYRAAARAAPAPSAPTGKCRIKGNISSSGTKIYHSPGQVDYDKTVIDTAKGERWFCTPAEARAAGWRAAMR
jgi:endonuclease YncB( thermonuclease family)